MADGLPTGLLASTSSPGLLGNYTGNVYTPGALSYLSGNAGFNTSADQSTEQALSTSYIPDYSQTPILESIAKQAQNMAPQVYQWGMDQYNKNQGNIDTMMRNALTYASPQRIAANMGMAESGVQQGAEAGRQNAIRDLQSYGIDPSSGRYAALDTANQVMSGAAAAGAGNQQRISDIATGNAMQNQAIAASNANVQTGYGAANAANALLGTASQLKYPPLGTESASSRQSSGASFGLTAASGGGTGHTPWQGGNIGPGSVAPFHSMAQGGEVPDEVSPTNGNAVDDVKANLTSGEFIIPKDVVEWQGKNFFYKLMAQARRMRAESGGEQNSGHVGYGAAS